MITLRNMSAQNVTWWLLPKYSFNLATAFMSGPLAPGGSVVVNPATTVNVVWGFSATELAAGCVAGLGATVDFFNVPNGAWCRVS